MNDEKIKEVLEHMKDLSYFDWINVRSTVDAAFRGKKNQAERQLKLDSVEELKSIQSRFGRK